jgi:hypothetical protein
VVVVGLLGVCALLWLLRAEVDPGPPAPPRDTSTAGGAAARAAHAVVMPTPTPPMPELPPTPEPAELHGHDTVDPCNGLSTPVIPAAFETVTVDGVTVAWRPTPLASPGPYDVAVAPTAIAYLVHGLLAEAAALTGTPRRERIAVVIYPPEAFHTETRAPRWADGIYDGGAVRVSGRPTAELGVEISTLRHELLHAQLHPVGCVPAWLNEGAAMYFAGAPPVRLWIWMLRMADSFDLTQVSVPSFTLLPGESAERAYAESLAMVLYIVDRAGEAGLRAAVQALRAAGTDTPRPSQQLWDQLYPGIGHRAVVDALAHRVFGVFPGRELDAILRGTICCRGVRSAGELRCRGVAPRMDRRRWVDDTAGPLAMCDESW